MSNLIFLTENFSEGETKYFAIDASKIETLNVSDTYDSHGLKIGTDDAGDSLELLSDKSVEIANKELNNENEDTYTLNPDDLFKIGSIISAYEFQFLNGAIKSQHWSPNCPAPL